MSCFNTVYRSHKWDHMVAMYFQRYLVRRHSTLSSGAQLQFCAPHHRIPG